MTALRPLGCYSRGVVSVFGGFALAIRADLGLGPGRLRPQSQEARETQLPTSSPASR